MTRVVLAVSMFTIGSCLIAATQPSGVVVVAELLVGFGGMGMGMVMGEAHGKEQEELRWRLGMGRGGV